MEPSFWDEADLAVGRMLKAGGYANVGEWALDSGYKYADDWDQWYDEEGYSVDVESKAVDAADSAGYFRKVN